MGNLEIRWTINIPITKNPDWMKLIGIAFATPFLLIIIMMLLDVEGMPDTSTMLIILAGGAVALALGFRLALWMLKDKYEVEYVLDNTGIVYRFSLNQMQQNAKITKAATVIGIAGMLAGKPNAALPRNAGMPDSFQQEKLGGVLWEKVKDVKYSPEKRVIYFSKGLGRGFSLFCNEDNYAQIEATVKEHTAHSRPPQ